MLRWSLKRGLGPFLQPQSWREGVRGWPEALGTDQTVSCKGGGGGCSAVFLLQWLSTY